MCMYNPGPGPLNQCKTDKPSFIPHIMRMQMYLFTTTMLIKRGRKQIKKKGGERNTSNEIDMHNAQQPLLRSEIILPLKLIPRLIQRRKHTRRNHPLLSCSIRRNLVMLAYSPSSSNRVKNKRTLSGCTFPIPFI